MSISSSLLVTNDDNHYFICFRDEVINPLKSLTAEDLVSKISASVEGKLIALFMQDEVG